MRVGPRRAQELGFHSVQLVNGVCDWDAAGGFGGKWEHMLAGRVGGRRLGWLWLAGNSKAVQQPPGILCGSFV